MVQRRNRATGQRSHRVALGAVTLGVLAFVGSGVHADEGGVPFWFSGQYASLAAVPATPGWSLPTQAYYYDGSASGSDSFPHAVDDHQTANAKFLSERGAAILIQQRDLTTEKLADMLRSLNREKLLDMAKKARALGKPEAARMVAQRCMEIAR